MSRWRWMALAALVVAACQRSEEAAPARAPETPGTPLAEQARAGYEAEEVPGPETSVGRGLVPAATPPNAAEGFEPRLGPADQGSDSRAP